MVRGPSVPAAACLLACNLLSQALALDFSGYLRSGIGESTSGGTQACFQLPGALASYRLGNECDHLFELELSQSLLSFEDGSTFSLTGMAELAGDYNHTPNFTGEHGSARMVQLYGEWDDVPGLRGGSLWVGRRYHNRYHAYLSSFYYWEQRGLGGGVEDLQIGTLKLSYAHMREDSILGQRYNYRHDLRLGAIDTWGNGALELGVSYVDQPDLGDASSGWALTVQHEQDNVLGGKNLLALQYGRVPGNAFGYDGRDSVGQGARSWRLVDYLEWQATPRFGGGVQLVYQRDKRRESGHLDWWSVGVRPTYALTEQFKLVAELGQDMVKSEDGTRKLTKLTFAPTWSPGGPGFTDRPEIRLYYTHAWWNRAAQRAADEDEAGSALSSSGAFGGARNGSNVGVQIEHWW